MSNGAEYLKSFQNVYPMSLSNLLHKEFRNIDLKWLHKVISPYKIFVQKIKVEITMHFRSEVTLL